MIYMLCSLSNLRKAFFIDVRNRSGFWKIPVFIGLLLLTIAAFTFIYLLRDTAVAPHESAGTPDPVEMEVTPSPVIPDEPEDEPAETEDISDEPEDEPADEPEEYIDPGFVTVNMNEADISSGYLVLVNHNHEYEIPELPGLVIITQAKAKTVPFRVLGENYYLRESVIEPLNEMMGDYISEKGYNTVAVISGFRSLEAQQRALDQSIARFGRDEALRRTAIPGHSEHHTGIAVDFGIYSGGSTSTFTGDGITSWFRQNSYRYGFILRYPQDKTRITNTMYEPWHFRYVGIPHSYIMYQNNWCLEEYIEHLRGYTFEEPFVAECEGVEYRIYITEDTAVPVPYDTLFDISGNNIDGFIVTVHTPGEQEALFADCCALLEDG